MKNLNQFISEASTSTGEQAKKLGLVHVGYGRYANPRGEITHKSDNGKLVRVDPNSADAQLPGGTTDPNADSGADASAPKKVTLTFGRFNPPTVGHQKLLDAVSKAAQGGDFRIYPSRTQDPKKNPLDPETKVKLMKKMFPDFSGAIVNDDGMRNIFDVLTAVNNEGYTDVVIVVGSDRVSEFDALSKKYNGTNYDFSSINVKSAGARDPDAEGVSGMSASKMRAAAASGDFDTFRQGIPDSLSDRETEELMMTLRMSMKLKESTQLWEIAPKLDNENLRENYFIGNILSIGTIVENLNTGVIGRVVNRGTNHVIYVDSYDRKYRGWLKDLSIIEEGADPSTQLEIGTDKYRNYVMELTPGERFLRKVSSINNKRKTTSRIKASC